MRNRAVKQFAIVQADSAQTFTDELNKKLIELVGPENDKGRRVTASQFGMFNVGFGCISWIRDNIITYYFGDEQ